MSKIIKQIYIAHLIDAVLYKRFHDYKELYGDANDHALFLCGFLEVCDEFIDGISGFRKHLQDKISETRNRLNEVEQ